jgi:hypothetical protein
MHCPSYEVPDLDACMMNAVGVGGAATRVCVTVVTNVVGKAVEAITSELAVTSTLDRLVV